MTTRNLFIAVLSAAWLTATAQLTWTRQQPVQSSRLQSGELFFDYVAGQQVGNDYRGLVVRNGKKLINK